jgi:hypothetical protein
VYRQPHNDMTHAEDIWNCYECGNPQGRHDLWFEGDLCEKCNIETPILDRKNNTLVQGDLVLLRDANNILDDFNSGDIMQYIGGDDDNIGYFIHCKTKIKVGIFADRTIKINKQSINI